jgi:ABC-type lipoprotein release transport system permease subunit
MKSSLPVEEGKAMLAIKLAYRNLIGAGLRTWLNVIVLAFVLFMMIWHYGIIDGWNVQARRDMEAWEVANGQYWHPNYDPYDFFTIEESHTKIPEVFMNAIHEGTATPVLLTQGTVYPDGRMQSMILRGIDPAQKVVAIPGDKLNTESEEIPAVIGKVMAKSCKLKEGDVTTIRWRDINGTFDAAEVKIVDIFHCNVPKVDAGQMYIPIHALQKMMQVPGEATLFIIDRGFETNQKISGWEFKDYDFLMAEMDEMIKMKRVGGSLIYVVLILLAMLAVFDTQVLSIFRRQKEIGTPGSFWNSNFNVAIFYWNDDAGWIRRYGSSDCRNHLSSVWNGSYHWDFSTRFHDHIDCQLSASPENLQNETH